jgi:hypothetical protein
MLYISANWKITMHTTRHFVLVAAAIYSLSGTLQAAATDPFIEEYSKCRLQPDEDRLACFDALQALLEETTATSDHQPEPLCESCESTESDFLSSDDPNYFVYTAPGSKELGDEGHAEFYLSLKYPLLQDKFENLKKSWLTHDNRLHKAVAPLIPSRFLFIYNGQYDFYVLESSRYESSPIISRRQNPGMAFEYDFPELDNGKLRVAWMHESNGQQLGPEDGERPIDSGYTEDLETFEKNLADEGLDYALTEVSRGWDYAQFRWQSSANNQLADFQPGWYRWQLDYRLYCNCQGFGTSAREDAIWWDENDDSEIHDYDGLRAMAEFNYIPFTDVDLKLFDERILTRVELQAGTRDSFLRNMGGKISLGMQFGNTRLTAFYFNGYGREPASYHLRTEYAGVGVELR